MTPDLAMTLAQEALKTALFVGAPVLGLGLAAGLLVSLFQATTQINEASLQFLPKVLAALVGMAIFGPWMLTTLVDFTRSMITMLPQLAK
ncbi:MAG TPA: flagellar biosynthesis protein FliQ [Symbiobacteriaceae bacterium]|nr:flagellar biosynthesis protein FliQ [Symbiobacteriaceae bacterium]